MNNQFLLGFSRIPGATAAKLQRVIEHFGSAEKAWQCTTRSEFLNAGLTQPWITTLFEQRRLIDLEHELKRLERLHIRLIDPSDAEYPSLLKEIHDPPQWLYVAGRIPSRPMVAVVGSRQMSEYAKYVTNDIAQALVARGVTVVSGLAFGVDSQGHETALAAGGTTVAVLGSGLNLVTPRQHEYLAREIVSHQGAVISEFPLDAESKNFHFPMRNRIISGLSSAVVVTAAAARSGALITARFALEQGRDVFAVPGSIYAETSAGCHQLIAEGAMLVSTRDDILRELQLGALPVLSMPELCSEEETLIMNCLSHESLHFDDIVRATGLTAATTGALLTVLETRGIILSHAGMKYTKAM